MNNWESMNKCGAERTWNWLGVHRRLSVVYSITQQQTGTGRYHRHSCALVKSKLCCTNNLGHSNCTFMCLPPKSLVYLIIFQVKSEKWRAQESKCRRGLSSAMIWAFYLSQTCMWRPNCQCHGSKRQSFQEVTQSKKHSPRGWDGWP